MAYNVSRTCGAKAMLALYGIIMLITGLTGCAAPRQPLAAPTTTQWSYRSYKGLQIHTAHWVIYTATTEPRWVDSLPPFAEAAYQHYQALVPAPATSRALALYVFANSLQWEDYGRLMGVPQNEVTVLGQLTGFARKDTAAVYVSSEPAYTFSAIGHVGMLEYLWLHDAGDAPLWVREGLATQAEGFDEQQDESLLCPGQTTRIRYVFDPKFNARRANQLRVAMQQKRLFNLDDLLSVEDFSKSPNPQISAQTYLAQLWAMMVFLQESKEYRRGFEQMRLDLASGALQQKVQGHLTGGKEGMTSGQAAFRVYITQDAGAFQARFTDWSMKYVGMVR